MKNVTALNNTCAFCYGTATYLYESRFILDGCSYMNNTATNGGGIAIISSILPPKLRK